MIHPCGLMTRETPVPLEDFMIGPPLDISTHLRNDARMRTRTRVIQLVASMLVLLLLCLGMLRVCSI